MMRGVTATEYTILLAVVLIIVLAVAGALLDVPGLSAETKYTHSDTYWKGNANPFGMLEHTKTPAGGFVAVLQNTGEDRLRFKSMALDGKQANLVSGGPTGELFAPGSRKTLVFDTGLPCQPGGNYEHQVTITYLGIDGAERTETGTVNLFGRCSAQEQEGCAACGEGICCTPKVCLNNICEHCGNRQCDYGETCDWNSDNYCPDCDCFVSSCTACQTDENLQDYGQCVPYGGIDYECDPDSPDCCPSGTLVCDAVLGTCQSCLSARNPCDPDPEANKCCGGQACESDANGNEFCCILPGSDIDCQNDHDCCIGYVCNLEGVCEMPPQLFPDLEAYLQGDVVGGHPAGSLFEITILTRNNGPGDAGPSQTRIDVDGMPVELLDSNDDVLENPFTVQELPSPESFAQQVRMQCGDAGPHELTITANAGGVDRVNEGGNEANNIQAYPFECILTTQPDLVADATGDFSIQHEVNSEFEATIYTRNIGYGASEPSYTGVLLDGETQANHFVNMEIPAGGDDGGWIYAVRCPSTAGSYTLSLIADSSENNVEENEGNNADWSASFECIEPAMPDMVASFVGPLPSSTQVVGNAFALNVGTSNDGDGGAPASTTLVDSASSGMTFNLQASYPISVVALAAGASAPNTGVLAVCTTPGPKTIRANADNPNVIQNEISEANNLATFALNCCSGSGGGCPNGNSDCCVPSIYVCNAGTCGCCTTTTHVWGGTAWAPYAAYKFTITSAPTIRLTTVKLKNINVDDYGGVYVNDQLRVFDSCGRGPLCQNCYIGPYDITPYVNHGFGAVNTIQIDAGDFCRGGMGFNLDVEYSISSMPYAECTVCNPAGLVTFSGVTPAAPACTNPGEWSSECASGVCGWNNGCTKCKSFPGTCSGNSDCCNGVCANYAGTMRCAYYPMRVFGTPPHPCNAQYINQDSNCVRPCAGPADCPAPLICHHDSATNTDACRLPCTIHADCGSLARCNNNFCIATGA
jgi:hypothetical protein